MPYLIADILQNVVAPDNRLKTVSQFTPPFAESFDGRFGLRTLSA